MIRHLILDRDGVLNVESDGGIAGPEDWAWIPGSLEALAHVTRAGIRLSIATNQAGIARGELRGEALEAIHARMMREARAGGALISAVFVCPHAAEEQCACRKPAPGLITAAIAAADIPACDTLVIGDDGRDMEAAHAAGVQGALVLTGKGAAVATLPAFRHVLTYPDLLSAARTLAAAERCGS